MKLITDRAEFNGEWNRLKHVVIPALSHSADTYSLDDIYEEIRLGRMQFWAGERSAIVTQLLQYPRIKSLVLYLIGGELGEVKTMEAEITNSAKKSGIERLQIGGRRGWMRALPGYEELGVFLVKEI